MSERSQPFLQRLWIDGKELNLHMVHQFAYMESIDMTTTGIMLMLRDESHALRDSGILNKGVKIKCEMADGYNLSTDSFTDEFIVSSFPIKNGVINIQGFQKDVHFLKTPAIKARFFTETTPEQILRELCPSLSVFCTVGRGTATYHLNAGTTPASLVRKMARDFGAACWISRGRVHFHSLDSLKDRSPLKTYTKNSAQGDGTLSHYSIINNDAQYERVMQKHWLCTSFKDGLLKNNEHDDKPKVLLPQMSRFHLSNQSKYIQSRIDALMIGQGDVVAGMPIAIEMKKESGHGGIDESVEALMLVKFVTHFEERMNYKMRVDFGVVRG